MDTKTQVQGELIVDEALKQAHMQQHAYSENSKQPQRVYCRYLPLSRKYRYLNRDID
jgi:hypothetical protein